MRGLLDARRAGHKRAAHLGQIFGDQQRVAVVVLDEQHGRVVDDLGAALDPALVELERIAQRRAEGVGVERLHDHGRDRGVEVVAARAVEPGAPRDRDERRRRIIGAQLLHQRLVSNARLLEVRRDHTVWKARHPLERCRRGADDIGVEPVRLGRCRMLGKIAFIGIYEQHPGQHHIRLIGHSR